MRDKENLLNFFGDTNETSDNERGWECFLKKHENITSVSKTNYIWTKWLDVADGVEILQDRVFKHQAMVLYFKQEKIDPKNCTSYIRTIHKKIK